ncbi:unnamed protein product [Vitrella brassicaformis CCMP3155]|uniref:Nuclear protein Es2 n=1 Tax=Vitrella brassicaformis (strain CCMP3155) TaxID=1169540 RepID=A0A0G4EKT3_VITBC|nr:unnamed protein product [Vitrella brassicaformis CCMP3155]|eukprot:CEL97110.1 unnamed protein product [Vitrella brassicaformis CCMP3155]
MISSAEERIVARDANSLASNLAVAVPNPHPLPRIPSRVLSEDDYTSMISEIIERDFFPDLPKLRAMRALLDLQRDPAASEQDVMAAHQRLQQMTPASVAGTPSYQEMKERRHMDEAQSVAAGRAKPTSIAAERSTTMQHRQQEGVKKLTLVDGRTVEVTPHVRLDKFQRHYTSEDNASFERIIAQEKQQLTDKEWWIEECMRYHNTRHLQLQDSVDRAGRGEGDGKVIKDLQYTKHQARNALMFYPQEHSSEGGVEERGLVGRTDEGQLSSKVAALDREIKNRNTRFPTALQEKDDAEARQAARMHAQVRAKDHEKAMNDIVRSGQVPSSRVKGAPVQSPAPDAPISHRGYAMVSTPRLHPGQGPDESPLMTWGEIASTPLLLDAAQAIRDSVNEPPGLSGMQGFSMQEPSQREAAGQRLADAAAEKLKSKNPKVLQTAGIRAAVTGPSSIFRRGTPSPSPRLSKPSPLLPGHSPRPHKARPPTALSGRTTAVQKLLDKANALAARGSTSTQRQRILGDRARAAQETAPAFAAHHHDDRSSAEMATGEPRDLRNLLTDGLLTDGLTGNSTAEEDSRSSRPVARNPFTIIDQRLDGKRVAGGEPEGERRAKRRAPA